MSLNYCTDLIPREELQIECRSAGRQVETKILSTQPPRVLDDRELDTIFKPLVDSVEEKTRTAVTRERDELEGKQADRRKREQMDDIVNDRRATLSETVGKIVINSSDYSHTRTFYLTNGSFVNELKRAYEDDWEMITNWEEEPSRLDEVDNDLFYEYNESDSFWEQYLPEIEVTLKPPYSQLIGLTKEGFFEFLKEYNPGREELTRIMNNLKKYNFLKWRFEIDSIVETYEYLMARPPLTTCQITLKTGPRVGKICHRSCARGKKRCSSHENKYIIDGTNQKKRRRL